MNQNRAVKASVAILMVLIVLIPSTSVAQTPAALQVDGVTSVNISPANIVWEKFYGGEADDRAFNAIPVEDGFLVVGSSESVLADTTMGWALLLEREGNMVWNKTYLYGSGTELRYAVNLTDGFLLVGNQFSPSGDVNGYVARVNSEGTLLWEKVLGGEKMDKLFSGATSIDGFAVFGLSYSFGSAQGAAWIVTLDGDGKVIWNKTYGESLEGALRSGVYTQDGSYVAAGYMDVSGEADYDFYLLKVASDGSLAWNKTYGGTESQKAYSIAQATDGYVLVGEAVSPRTSTDAGVLKVDLDGNKLWEKAVGGINSDSPAYITPSKDGGFLVCGFTFSFGAGERDFWLFKINDSGQVQFSCTQGTEAFEEAYSVIETGDGGYISVGWADPLGRPDLIGKALYDYYFVKLEVTNSNGTQIPLFIVYGIVIFAVLAATLVLIFKLRGKGKE